MGTKKQSKHDAGEDARATSGYCLRNCHCYLGDICAYVYQKNTIHMSTTITFLKCFSFLGNSSFLWLAKIIYSIRIT